MNLALNSASAFLAFSTFVSATAFAGGSRDLLAQLDGYGYFASADASVCAYDPIDIDAAGNSLNPVAASAEIAALDDGAALLSLTQPFRFYAGEYTSAVVSTNGYLAFASTLDDENGGDFSNDAFLPAVPDNSPLTAARIYAYHDDLTGEGAGAELRQSYFTNCPRSSGLVPDEACSVIQWKNWTKLGGNQPITVQLLLYHASDSIAIQYGAVDASAGNSACVGLQAPDAADGGAWTCNGTRAVTAGSAVCFFDPDHLPGGAVDTLFADGFEPPTP